MKRNKKCPSPGVLAQLQDQAIYTRHTHNKLRGFWRANKQRGVFVVLGSRRTGFAK